MDKKYIKGVELIKSSAYRLNILKAINSKLITPSEISKITEYRLNHVSLFLGELKKAQLIECLNEEAKKGRLYRLTQLGKKVLIENGG